MAEPTDPNLSRRDLLSGTLRGAALVGAGVFAGALVNRGAHAVSQQKEPVWQLDPNLCNSCGKCATECVLEVSAVRCFHLLLECGFCLICSGYTPEGALAVDSNAENLLCPTDALKRMYDPKCEVGDGYVYHVDQDKCVGCGRCSANCYRWGNGSLYLQIDHSRCVECNECRIARQCPARAFKRVPADQPYLPLHPAKTAGA